jgi:hypothetical protein
MVIVVPSPLIVTASLRVRVHVPDAGNPLKVTLPVGSAHVGWTIGPTTGGGGTTLTTSEYVATAGVHGKPSGLFVVTVMVIVLPASEADGVYVKAKGELADEGGLSDPPPFSDKDTLVALPPNILPLTVIAEVPQVLPLVEESVTVGGLAHPHDTVKASPVVVHPDEFLTVIVWVPLATFVKTFDVWKPPASSLYVYPPPTGLVTVISAFP